MVVPWAAGPLRISLHLLGTNQARNLKGQQLRRLLVKRRLSVGCGSAPAAAPVKSQRLAAKKWRRASCLIWVHLLASRVDHQTATLATHDYASYPTHSTASHEYRILGSQALVIVPFWERVSALETVTRRLTRSMRRVINRVRNTSFVHTHTSFVLWTDRETPESGCCILCFSCPSAVLYKLRSCFPSRCSHHLCTLRYLCTLILLPGCTQLPMPRSGGQESLQGCCGQTKE